MSPLIPGAPDHELSRSPAAQRIGELAAMSGLRLSHFEHRVDLELPEEWEPKDRPDLGVPQTWRSGILPETKYRSFHNDRIIGSFHPVHRAKWTAHELCHGLIGFAWYPGCSRFFQALSARLSEVLPVALYYFFDEAGLRRCPEHDGGGALFGTFCPECEAAARRGPVEDPRASRWRQEGQAFVERELDAVHRSLRQGRMVTHRYHSLELSSDGLGYAAAHGPRLDSEEFALFVEHFFTEGQGWFSSIEGLQARVEEITEDLCGGTPAQPWSTDPWMWVTQDIGWRLLQVRADCGGPLRDRMDRLICTLASQPTARGVQQALTAYAELAQEWIMPSTQTVFATGYSLPEGHGHGTAQLVEGVQSSLPMTCEFLGDGLIQKVSDFAERDDWDRRALGLRFSEQLDASTPLGELARLEAALCHAPPPDLEAATLRGMGSPPFRLRRGFELLCFNYSVDSALDPTWRANPEALTRRETPLYLVLFREPDGDVQVLEVLSETWNMLVGLQAGEAGELPPDELELMLHWGILLPTPKR